MILLCPTDCYMSHPDLVQCVSYSWELLKILLCSTMLCKQHLNTPWLKYIHADKECYGAGQRELGESNTDGEFAHSALWGIKTRLVFEEDDLNSTDTCHHWWLYLNPDTFGLEEPNMVDKKVKECCNPALVPAEVLGVLYNYCQQYVHNCYGINSICARDFSVKLVQKPIKQTMKNHIDVAVEFFWLLSISILQFIASST